MLLEIFSHDVTRAILSAWDDLTVHYRPLFRFAALLWALGLALEILKSPRSLGSQLITFVKGVLVILYLGEPALPRAFLALMEIPDHASHIVLSHVTGSMPGAGGDFAAGLDNLLDYVGERSGDMLASIWTSFDLTVFMRICGIYVFLAAFLAIVLYVAALATFFQAALLIFLPFVVALYPIAYTRPLFDGLIRQGLSFALVLPLLNVVVTLVVSPLAYFLRDFDQMSLYDLLPFAILTLVGSLLTLQIPQLAAGVAGGVGMPIPRIR